MPKWYQRRSVQLAAAAVLLVLVIFLLGRASVSNEDATLAFANAQPKVVHLIQRGEFLKSIAPQYNVGWEAVLLANESYLQEKYEETCGKFSPRYRDNPRRRGLFCNDRYNRPYGNTLRAGWRIVIPADSAPPEIDRIVATETGKRVAIVIDDTGSMSDDRHVVGEFYLAALRKHGKDLAGIFLYADGQVRTYKAGNVEFLTAGDFENTYSALEAAADTNPDTIILITDEPGDDWPDADVLDELPQTVAHCLPEQGDYACREPLQQLADATGGKYVDGT